ncbi:Uncharacterized protein DBV15_07604 [Temnothorax longispinosus]|uniref:Uncharacterized protein n=1 Tax=Temnothorax longispinosus TaxID=300112 RepID=A0A4S2KEX0_9HYME|nr:Uncharacterized protein DBV15_07604 [Temnothorax longispinosus]
MKWPVKKLCGSPSERPDKERTQTPGPGSREPGHEDTKRLRNVECGTAAWRMYVDSGARSSELFIPGAMREKKITTMELAQSEGQLPVNSRFAPPSPFCTSSGDESRKATCEAVVTPASEIGNCPTNGITNACALAPDGK